MCIEEYKNILAHGVDKMKMILESLDKNSERFMVITESIRKAEKMIESMELLKEKPPE